MRENRTYGSEGGGTETNRFSLPLSNARSKPRAIGLTPCRSLNTNVENALSRTALTPMESLLPCFFLRWCPSLDPEWRSP